MANSDTLDVAAVSDSCVAEDINFTQGSIVVKDVFLTDDVRFDFSEDLSSTLSAPWTLSEEVLADDCVRGKGEELDDEVFVKDEESFTLMSALGLPTTFATNSDLKASKGIRKRNSSRRRKNPKVTSSCDDSSSLNEVLLHQDNFNQNNDDREVKFTSHASSQGFAEKLPSSPGSTLAFPANVAFQESLTVIDIQNCKDDSTGLLKQLGERLHEVNQDFRSELEVELNRLALAADVAVQELSTGTDMKNDKDDPTGLVQNLAEGLPEVNQTSKDFSIELDAELNNEAIVSHWMPCWHHQSGRYYFFNSKTLESTWESPEGWRNCVYFSENKANMSIEDDQDTEACSELGGKCVEPRSSNVQRFCRESKREVIAFPWVRCWDDQYSRHYFCNSKTLETTWDLPEGLESCICSSAADSGLAARAASGSTQCGNSLLSMTKKNYRRRKLSENQSSSLVKYWIQRFHLFSKFNAGMKLDDEGWFSVTPEVIAKHQAARCNHGVIVDAFAGVGGNAIQFALAGHYVIAIDNDPKKIEYGHHNANIYGVADRIDFLLADFFVVSSSLRADVVFLAPPWGGPEYLNADVYDMQSMMKPKGGMCVFRAAQAVASNVIFFVPRNVNMDQLTELSQESSPHLALEVEKNFLNGKLKALTAYYGHFACLHKRK